MYIQLCTKNTSSGDRVFYTIKYYLIDNIIFVSINPSFRNILPFSVKKEFSLALKNSYTKYKNKTEAKGREREREREREKWMGAYKDWSSLGYNIDSIKYPREIAKKGQQQTNPKLDLN